MGTAREVEYVVRVRLRRNGELTEKAERFKVEVATRNALREAFGENHVRRVRAEAEETV